MLADAANSGTFALGPRHLTCVGKLSKKWPVPGVKRSAERNSDAALTQA